MNSHLSEILSWLLEPLANSMMGKSSEVVSAEDLKHKIDKLNLANKDWKPEAELEHPIGQSSVMADQLDLAPGLCGCEECADPEESVSGSEEQLTSEAGPGSCNKSEGEGGVCVNTQTGSVSVADSQSNTVNSVTQESSQGPDDVSSDGVEYIFSSVRRRGNRNKALLLKERREIY